MADKPKEVKERVNCVLSVFPEPSVNLQNKTNVLVQLDNGRFREIEAKGHVMANFKRHVAWIKDEHIDRFKQVSGYSTEFITLSDLKKFEKDRDGRTTANGFKYNMFRRSQLNREKPFAERGDVDEYIKELMQLEIEKND